MLRDLASLVAGDPRDRHRPGPASGVTAMTADDFNAAIAQLGISRAELCRRLGLSLNTGTAYANGRAEIPTYIALAIAALIAGLPPYRGKPNKRTVRR